jgi:hypothetical protein
MQSESRPRYASGELQSRNFAPCRKTGYSERSEESRWYAGGCVAPRRFFAALRMTFWPTLQLSCVMLPVDVNDKAPQPPLAFLFQRFLPSSELVCE